MSTGRALGAALTLLLVATLGGGSANSQDLSGDSPGARDRFRWPVRGRLLQAFKSGDNDGIDIEAPVGEAVHAAADGAVTYAGDELKTASGDWIVWINADCYQIASWHSDAPDFGVISPRTVCRSPTAAAPGR